MSKNLQSLIYLVMLVCLTSCKSMKLSFAERIEMKNNEQKIELIKNQAIITTQLEGKEQRLMLDLGSTACVLYDTSSIHDFYKKEKSTFGSARGAGSGKIKILQVPVSLRDSLFSSGNKVFTIIDNPAMRDWGKCSAAGLIAGLYGANLFSRHKAILLMDLQEKKLSILTDSVFANTVGRGYKEIKSKFSMFGIKLYVLINGKEYPFGFDTGFNGTFTMPAGEDLQFVTEPHVSFEGMAAISVTGIETGNTDVYDKKEISFNGEPITTSITVSNVIKAQNMGMGFMKGFNWIIDYKHKKMYAKRLLPAESLVVNVNYNYVPKIINGRLLVAMRKTGLTGYNIGDEIIAVNGLPVDDSNKCEVAETLIKNNDWKALNVKTQPVVIH